MKTCPELQSLHQALEAGDEEGLAHLEDCAACAGHLEEHRELERELFRLTDPMPPYHFVSLVMAKVRAQPAVRPTGAWTGLSLIFVSLALAAVSFVAGHGRLGAVGTSLASSLLSVRAVVRPLVNAMDATWHFAAVPMAVCVSSLLIASLLGLRQLAPLTAPADLTEVS